MSAPNGHSDTIIPDADLEEWEAVPRVAVNATGDGSDWADVLYETSHPSRGSSPRTPQDTTKSDTTQPQVRQLTPADEASTWQHLSPPSSVPDVPPMSLPRQVTAPQQSDNAASKGPQSKPGHNHAAAPLVSEPRSPLHLFWHFTAKRGVNPGVTAPAPVQTHVIPVSEHLPVPENTPLPEHSPLPAHPPLAGTADHISPSSTPALTSRITAEPQTRAQVSPPDTPMAPFLTDLSRCFAHATAPRPIEPLTGKAVTFALPRSQHRRHSRRGAFLSAMEVAFPLLTLTLTFLAAYTICSAVHTILLLPATHLAPGSFLHSNAPDRLAMFSRDEDSKTAMAQNQRPPAPLPSFERLSTLARDLARATKATLPSPPGTSAHIAPFTQAINAVDMRLQAALEHGGTKDKQLMLYSLEMHKALDTVKGELSDGLRSAITCAEVQHAAVHAHAAAILSVLTSAASALPSEASAASGGPWGGRGGRQEATLVATALQLQEPLAESVAGWESCMLQVSNAWSALTNDASTTTNQFTYIASGLLDDNKQAIVHVTRLVDSAKHHSRSWLRSTVRRTGSQLMDFTERYFAPAAAAGAEHVSTLWSSLAPQLPEKVRSVVQGAVESRLHFINERCGQLQGLSCLAHLARDRLLPPFGGASNSSEAEAPSHAEDDAERESAGEHRPTAAVSGGCGRGEAGGCRALVESGSPPGAASVGDLGVHEPSDAASGGLQGGAAARARRGTEWEVVEGQEESLRGTGALQDGSAVRAALEAKDWLEGHEARLRTAPALMAGSLDRLAFDLEPLLVLGEGVRQAGGAVKGDIGVDRVGLVDFCRAKEDQEMLECLLEQVLRLVEMQLAAAVQ